MKKILVQISPWEKTIEVAVNVTGLVMGDKVILSSDSGQEIGSIIGFKDNEENEVIEVANKSEENNKSDEEVFEFLRKASPEDVQKMPDDKFKKQAIKDCRQMVKDHNLPMKLVDVNFSFDNSRITFAFIADGRVDFRNLVKDLSRKFGKSIRLHQIGIRDEAKICGDFGHCGHKLCCKGFLKDLVSITSDMAEVQQCVHRGSDRISGACGRLMCCLAYEEKGYKELSEAMPAIGKRVNVDGKKGVVVGHHILKQSVNVQFDDKQENGKYVVEVNLNRHKK